MASHQTHIDQKLLREVAAGDQRAFGILMEILSPQIYSRLVLYCKNAQRAEEETQDILLGLWRNRERLSGMENFSGYVFVITRNRVKKILKETILATVEPPEDKLHSTLATPDQTAERKELEAFLHTAIEQMPPKRKDVFVMSRLEGLSHEAISQKLGISKNTIKQHIREALVFLRTFLWEHRGNQFCWITAFLIRLFFF